MNRYAQRPSDRIRPVKVTYGIYEYALGSVLIAVGRTKVLCAVNIADGVPQFLRGTGSGWLTAHYAMLPASTQVRVERESVKERPGRSVEISRLIGRSVRAAIDLQQLGERTVTVDCDVLQADGGTRAAAITGSYYALMVAQQKLLASKLIAAPFLREQFAAVSVGIKDGQLLLDLDGKEDSSIDADVNFVLTHSGNVLEIQGSGEKGPVRWQDIVAMQKLAQDGILQIADYIRLSEPSESFVAAGILSTSVG